MKGREEDAAEEAVAGRREWAVDGRESGAERGVNAVTEPAVVEEVEEEEVEVVEEREEVVEERVLAIWYDAIISFSIPTPVWRIHRCARSKWRCPSSDGCCVDAGGAAGKIDRTPLERRRLGWV